MTPHCHWKKAFTSEQGQKKPRLYHLVAVDRWAKRVNQQFENLALERLNFVDHGEVGPRELDAQIRPDRSLGPCAAAAAFLLVSVVGHRERVKVEDEGAVSAFTTAISKRFTIYKVNSKTPT